MNSRLRAWLVFIFMVLTALIWPVVYETRLLADGNDVYTLAWSNRVFAEALYTRLANESGNLFFSPYSVSTALAMTYAGARGETAAQMANALHFTLPEPQSHAAFAEIGRELSSIPQKGDLDLSVANAIWPDKKYVLLPAFVQLLKDKYQAEPQPVDFVTAAEQARSTINAWVEQKTNDKIKELILPGGVDSSTRLVLSNAIYFKGKWKEPFKKKLTRDGEFWLTPQKGIHVQMMHQSGQANYGEDDILQILELPYRGDELSMVILLPKEKGGLSEVEKRLTDGFLVQLFGRLSEENVVITLPKFKLEQNFELSSVLAAMGMPYAFMGEKADFSGMCGTRDLFISKVQHKAFVDVNEEGTEAAAATGVVMEFISAVEYPFNFNADHPFVFLIREKRFGSILFMGRVEDPSK
jgi:serpin B